MKRLLAAAFAALFLAGFAATAQTPFTTMPDYQVSTKTNGAYKWVETDDTPTNTLRAVLQWLDDYIDEFVHTPSNVFDNVSPTDNTHSSYFNAVDLKLGALDDTSVSNIIWQAGTSYAATQDVNNIWYLTYNGIVVPGTGVTVTVNGAPAVGSYDPVTSNFTVSLTSAAHGFMPGTNIAGATYDAAASNWVLSAGGASDIGYIEGLVPTYVDADTISLSPGYGYCSSNWFAVGAATNIDLSLSSSRDIHYIYIDHSENSYPTGIVFRESTDEPTQSADGAGWYLGDDRCVASVRSRTAASALVPFSTVPNGRSYKMFMSKSATGAEVDILLDPGAPDTQVWSNMVNISGATMDELVPEMVTSLDISIYLHSTGVGHGLVVSQTGLDSISIGASLAGTTNAVGYGYGYEDSYYLFNIPFTDPGETVVYAEYYGTIDATMDAALFSWEISR